MFKNYFSILIIFLSVIALFFSIPSKSNSDFYFPTQQKHYAISSYYGYRTLGTYHFHNGIDVPLVAGTPLYSLGYGTVSFVGFISGYGNSVIIKYENGYKSLYGHISSNLVVTTGQTVSPKQLVAYVGPKYLENGKLNGFTTGPHLHYTLYKNNKVIDPKSITYNK